MSINSADVKDILDVQSILAEAKVTADEELLATLVNWKHSVDNPQPSAPVQAPKAKAAEPSKVTKDDEPF